jgi:hypothetical protein
MLPAPTASKTCAKHSLRHSFNPQHFSLLDSHISTPTDSASHVHCCGRSYPLPPPCPSQALAFLYAICYCHSSTPGDAACCWPCAARCVVLLHALPLLAVLLAACCLLAMAMPCAAACRWRLLLLCVVLLCCWLGFCCCRFTLTVLLLSKRRRCLLVRRRLGLPPPPPSGASSSSCHPCLSHSRRPLFPLGRDLLPSPNPPWPSCHRPLGRQP